MALARFIAVLVVSLEEHWTAPWQAHASFAEDLHPYVFDGRILTCCPLHVSHVFFRYTGDSFTC